MKPTLSARGQTPGYGMESTPQPVKKNSESQSASGKVMMLFCDSQEPNTEHYHALDTTTDSALCDVM
jgi:hypothetical protein